MIPYKDLNGDSNISSYKLGDDYIIIEFKSGDYYKYACPPASKANLEEAKRLAEIGDGLLSHIMRKMKKDYTATGKSMRDVL